MATVGYISAFKKMGVEPTKLMILTFGLVSNTSTACCDNSDIKFSGLGPFSHGFIIKKLPTAILLVLY